MKNKPQAVRFIFVFLMLFVSLFACSRRKEIAPNGEKNAGEERPVLALSILPQTWFAQRLAGDKVRIVVLVGPGQNPHNYELTPAQMKDLAQAGVWVLSGAEFEISLEPKIRGVFPGLAIIDGTQGVVFRMLESGEDHYDEDYYDDHEDEHDGQGIDRHTWLGCEPAKILSAHIREALVMIDPAREDLYTRNYYTLISDIDNEFDSLRVELAPLDGSRVYVYHPGFGYFLDEFGIYQEAVETGGKEPGPRELARIISEMKQERIPAIFVQAQFPVNAARTIAQATGAELISLDPLSADWLANIRLMGSALKKTVK